MNTSLKELLFSLANKYSNQNEKITHSWNEIVQHYDQPERAYHTMDHLYQLRSQLEGLEKKFNHPEIIWWSLFFHDFVYDASRRDNEERSALAAMIHLNNLRVPMMDIMRVQSMILATKNHEPEESDTDILYFLDADLSILGSEEDIYTSYSGNIRKEYNHFPEAEYRAGRKKVLEHFMQMQKIYKTEFFYNLLEQKARENLKKEWLSL